MSILLELVTLHSESLFVLINISNTTLNKTITVSRYNK